MRRPLFVLLGAVGLVLLVACANVANLMFSRSVVRQREISIRAALGAPTYRLLQVMLLEGLVLALAGGALGLALGHWALRLIPSVLATSLPAVMDVSLDWRVMLFTLTLSVVTACLFSLAPFAAGAVRDLTGARHAALQDGRTIGGRRQHRVQGMLVVSSVALAFVLLVGAGLLIRSFSALMAREPGFAPDNVLSLRVALPAAGYSQPQHACARSIAACRSDCGESRRARRVGIDRPSDPRRRRASRVHARPRRRCRRDCRRASPSPGSTAVTSTRSAFRWSKAARSPPTSRRRIDSAVIVSAAMADALLAW